MHLGLGPENLCTAAKCAPVRSGHSPSGINLRHVRSSLDFPWRPQMFHFSRSPASIRFLCKPEDHGVIAEPVPAKTVLPDWFRKLPPVDKQQTSATNSGLTIKRCMPFLDAMTTGWILPLAASVRLDIKDEGRTV